MITDPIADMISRVKNGYLGRKVEVLVPHSKFKESLAEVLKKNSYIEDFEVITDKFKVLKLTLRYDGRKAAIEEIKRVSKPGVRVYAGKDQLPRVLSGYGVSVLSTSKGLMTDREARKIGLGGEILCKIW